MAPGPVPRLAGARLPAREAGGQEHGRGQGAHDGTVHPRRCSHGGHAWWCFEFYLSVSRNHRSTVEPLIYNTIYYIKIGRFNKLVWYKIGMLVWLQRYCTQHSLRFCSTAIYTLCIMHIQDCFPPLAPRCGTPSSPGSPSLSTRCLSTRSTSSTRCTLSAQGKRDFTSTLLISSW